MVILFGEGQFAESREGFAAFPFPLSPHMCVRWVNEATIIRIIRMRCLLLVAAKGLALPVVLAEPHSSSKQIDPRPALVIGDWEISHYLIDKYFTRYVTEFRQRHHHDPDSAKKSAWFDEFFAKQIVIAQVAASGYVDRSEIRQNVARMERHMLTQSYGPFYQQLFSPAPVPEEKLKALHSMALITVDLIIARFGDAASEAKWLETDFSRQSVDEQTRRIMKCRDLGAVEISDGARSWPFAPFFEMADTIDTAASGRWLRHSEPNWGIYYILVRGARSRVLENSADGLTDFKVFAGYVQRETFARKRRLELLTSAAFAFEITAGQRAIKLWTDRSSADGRLAELPPESLAEAPLFHYRVDNSEITVCVETYRRHFNELFIRKVPRTLAELRLSAEDFVVEEFDFRAAKAQGIDTTAQFVEDRRGFLGFQLLDLFEKEVLVPQLHTDSEEIERYYQEHQADYLRAARIRGRLLEFKTAEDAYAWRQQHADANASIVATAIPTSDKEVELSDDHPFPGLESVQKMIMRSPDGARFGPITHAESAIIFIKQADVTRSLMPLPTVTDAIRGILARQALNKKEQQLAGELVANLKIEDHIDYARYGVTADRVKLPWRR